MIYTLVAQSGSSDTLISCRSWVQIPPGVPRIMSSNINTHIICPECNVSFIEEYIGDLIWDKEFLCPLCNSTIIAIKDLGIVETVQAGPPQHQELEWRKTKAEFLKIANGGKCEEEYTSSTQEK